MKFGEERIYARVDDDQLPESHSGFQAHRAVGVIECFKEGCLQLGKEWFQHGTTLK